MKFTKQQFRLSTLFHATTIVACCVGLVRAFGSDGLAFLLLLIALPIVITFVVVAYVRAMSWLFDVVVGPFFLR